MEESEYAVLLRALGDATFVDKVGPKKQREAQTQREPAGAFARARLLEAGYGTVYGASLYGLVELWHRYVDEGDSDALIRLIAGTRDLLKRLDTIKAQAAE